jgi:hypothetical protein
MVMVFLKQVVQQMERALGDIWMKEVGNPEAVLVYGFNNVTYGSNLAKNNGWEQAIRPKDIFGGGSFTNKTDFRCISNVGRQKYRRPYFGVHV